MLNASQITLTDSQIQQIAKKIWQNECGGSIDGLTTWNTGEGFASLGIGHFIWYPENQKGPFEEQFPHFLAFAKQADANIPEWLKDVKGCPWRSRDAFLKDLQSPKMVELRAFLSKSLFIQAQFIVKRLENLLPTITQGLSSKDKDHVMKMFDRLAKEPQGVYVLLDYLNFKGEGTSLQERYQGKGWGLLQVLQQMPDLSNRSPTEEFVIAAKAVLSQRVQNAPPERNENRWLKGWFNRLESYLKES